ncbi:MAG: M23 family metallopeptidase [Myxococcales bacterium]|nr:M23 family metallopeptidase [Myxococcales bacterium]MCB9735590.1 M23 family metallopeptidase [Deltaproteobacteria bacterium]
MRRSHCALLVACALGAAACATAPVSPEPPAPSAPVTARVVTPPAPLRQGGLAHLGYELVVENVAAVPLTLTGLDVDADGASWVRYDDAALAARLRPLPGPEPPPGAPAATLAPGGRAIIYLWLAAGADGALPSALSHALSLSDGAQATWAALAPVAVTEGAPRSLSAPLAGAGWLAVNAPANDSPHRRSVLDLGPAGVFLAQRYAVDLVRVGGPEGTHRGDPLRNDSYFAYGAEVLAGADGVVVEVREDLPENVPGPESRAVAITPETIAGNHVIVDVGGGAFAVYAHLQPGSVRVAEGERVAEGDVLGLVGNSGNSTEPHLHVHVCDAPSVLRCQGLPFGFARFVEQEVHAPAAGEAGAAPSLGPPVGREGAMPADRALIDFGAAAPMAADPARR